MNRAWFLALLCLWGCGASPANKEDTSDPGDDVPKAWSFETIGSETVVLYEEPREVELVRAARPDGGASYLLYIRASASPAALVVHTEPYAGITWTGEEVDARWAAGGKGLHPDVDAPAYDGDDVIAYEEQTVQMAVEGSAPWIVNGFAVIRPYARFYAGGSLEDDMQDAAAPYHFALTLPETEIDRARIGTFGGSWGGMMAIAGAARAPEGAAPLTVVAMAPPTDFADLWAYTDALPSMYPVPAQPEAFFSPYRRRIEVATGGPAPGPGFEPYSHEALCDGLRSRVVMPHDEWDVLIPVEQTRSLDALCPDRIEPLTWYRQGPTDYAAVGLDHGPFLHEPGFPSLMTFSYSHLVLALAPPGTAVLTLANEEGLKAFLTTVREEQLAGGDAAEALPRLRELASTQLTAFDPVAEMMSPSADILAKAVNAVYGTTYDGTSLRAALDAGLPQP